MTQNALDQVVSAQKHGSSTGVVSVCSANPFVLEATLLHALARDEAVLIEATCNQVNQFGGYTGMTPDIFSAFVEELVERTQIPRDQVIIGGDHLGPSAWQNEPADRAMDKARVLINDAVLAGYNKIHLDASMRCADDPGERLSPDMAADRAADLALVSERACEQRDPACSLPRYVIGTEVPPPGGIRGDEEALRVTPPYEVEETIEITREAFVKRGLESAWDRVQAVVVQPGVEYGDQTIYDYSPERAAPLANFIEGVEGLVYEAHSTDFQNREALRQLVMDHFAILKIGPALTFAYREAVFALSMIEDEWLTLQSGKEPSDIRQALDRAMTDDPRYWKDYYSGTPNQQAFARRYSLSDRSRYYWPVDFVQEALDQMMANLSTELIPLTLLSQFMPVQARRVREGHIPANPHSLIVDHISERLADYSYACKDR